MITQRLSLNNGVAFGIGPKPIDMTAAGKWAVYRMDPQGVPGVWVPFAGPFYSHRLATQWCDKILIARR